MADMRDDKAYIEERSVPVPADLASRFGVSVSNVRLIKAGKAWGHL